MKKRFTLRFAQVLCVVIATSGILLRFLKISKESLSFDEVATYVVSHLPVSHITSMRYFDLANPPLYYFLMQLYVEYISKWLQISETILRFPSFVFSSIALIFFVLLTIQTLRSNLGRLTALMLYATSIPLIHFSQVARAYALQQFFVSILLCLTIALLKQPRSVTILAGIAVSSTALLYTHYSSAVLLLGYFVSLLCVIWLYKPDKNNIISIFATGWIVLSLSVPLVINQIFPILFQKGVFDPKTTWEYSIPSVFSIFDFLMGGVFTSFPSSWLWFALLLLSILVYLFRDSRIYHKEDRSYPHIMTFFLIFMITECIIIMPRYTRTYLFNTYYYLFLSAPIFLLLGFYAAKNIVIFFTVMLCLFGIAFPSLYRFYKSPHEIQFRNVAVSLSEMGATAHATVAVRPCMASVPLLQYYAKEYHIQCFSDIIPHENPVVFVVALTTGKVYMQDSSAYSNQMIEFGYTEKGTHIHKGILVMKFLRNTYNE